SPRRHRAAAGAGRMDNPLAGPLHRRTRGHRPPRVSRRPLADGRLRRRAPAGPDPRPRQPRAGRRGVDARERAGRAARPSHAGPAGRVAWHALTAGALALVVTSAVLSHAVARLEARPGLLALDALHQLAAAIWIGGLAHLASWAGLQARRAAGTGAAGPDHTL